MKKIMLVMVSLITAILVSCMPAAATVPSDAIVPTSALTLPPALTATPTITPTIIPEPTPMGGGDLKVAFYATDPTGDYLIVGNYFSGKIYYKIQIRHMQPAYDVSWSPNGAYVLFVDPPVAAIETENLKVNLLNVKTGQVTLLNTLPASAGVQWNRLWHIEWSPDSKYVLYNGTNLASVDGIVQDTQFAYSDWLPDNKTLTDFRNSYTFDIEENAMGPLSIPGFSHLDISELTQDYMLLNPFEKDKVEAILYPDDLSNTAAWQYDALMSNKVTLVTFSPEIQKPQIYKLMAITELSDNRLSISGMGSFKVGKETYDAFCVIVDKNDFPMVVEVKNLYGSLDENLPAFQREYPVMFSPDGQLVLLGSMAQDETWYHLKLTLRDNNGQEIRVDEKMSQFNGLSKVGARVADLGSSATHFFLSGIDFYWQP